METKNQDDFVFSCLVVDVSPLGLSGGQALFWKRDTPQIIYTHMLRSRKKVFYLTSIYGDTVRHKRLEVWNKLSKIVETHTSIWILSDDFNKILDNSKKREESIRHEGSFVNFKSFIAHNGFWDVHSSLVIVS